MILITTQNFAPDIGGIQIYLTGLAETLAGRGHDVSVFCDAARSPAGADSARPYKVARFGGPRPWIRLTKSLAVQRRLRQGGVDVVIADTWKSLEHLSSSDLKNARVICIAHGAEFLVAPGSAKARRMIACLAKADIVAANSYFTAGLVRPLLTQKSALRVVLPGVYPPSGVPRDFLARPPNGEQRIVTIARFDPYKGIDKVLEAVARLRARYPALHYDIIGDGKDRNRLHALAAELGLGNSVTFRGAVSDAQKAQLLAQANIFALPNRREPGEVEGFGIVFPEAGAFGLPCIAGRDGGTSDAVRDGETGLLVNGADGKDVQNGLATLLNNPELANRMGAAGSSRFWNEFAWSAAIDRFERAIFAPI